MECGLRLGIPFVGCYRAGTTGSAGSDSAILAGALKVLPASGIVIEATHCEGGDRTGGETRAPYALLARMRSVSTGTELESLAKAKRPSV